MTGPGELYQRNREWHPPALMPGYKTSVARSSRYALLSLQDSASELSGPTFGHSDIGSLGKDLIRNYADAGRHPVARCPIEILIPNRRANDQLVAALDLNTTIPLDATAYKFGICLQGDNKTVLLISEEASWQTPASSA